MSAQPATCPACASGAQDYYVRCPGCQERRRKHIEKWHKQPGVDNLPGPSTPGHIPAPLRPFDIGHVPTGWTRGAPVRIKYPPQGGWGTVEEDVGFLAHQRSQPLCADHVGALQFRAADHRRVEAWLYWWRSPG